MEEKFKMMRSFKREISKKLKRCSISFYSASALTLILHLHMCTSRAYGDAVLISNTRLIHNDVIEGLFKTSDFKLIQLDISWKNSWRDNINWDAVWIFVKYRVERDSWQHATLNFVNGVGGSDGHTEPKGATITTSSDGKGIFLYQSEINEEMRPVEFPKVLLRWNSGYDGVPQKAKVEIRVYAIEMVYVPTGAFAVGSGGDEFKAFKTTTINTSDALTKPTGKDGILGSPQGGYPAEQIPPEKSSWPNGFNAYYCMKYEVSQGLYADFLNTLSKDQARNRCANKRSASYTIRKRGGTYFAIVPNSACNFLSWGDAASFADWSALRPLTELEFEKACRGPRVPVMNEYAWATDKIHKSVYKLVNEGTIDEYIEAIDMTENGNAAYNETNGYKGPYRCGIFMLSSTNYHRERSGSSFYRILELSGNLWERTISISHPVGRKFTGEHGDGKITPVTGDADVNKWPGQDAMGAGFRGGGWRSGASVLRVSDRVGADDVREGRSSAIGFRAVRNVPLGKLH